MSRSTRVGGVDRVDSFEHGERNSQDNQMARSMVSLQSASAGDRRRSRIAMSAMSRNNGSGLDEEFALWMDQTAWLPSSAAPVFNNDEEEFSFGGTPGSLHRALSDLEEDRAATLQLSAANAQQYEKSASVYAFQTDSPACFLKSWGMSEVLESGWVIIGAHTQQNDGGSGAMDIYVLDDDEFQSSYEECSSPHMYRKAARVWAHIITRATQIVHADGSVATSDAVGETALLQNCETRKQWFVPILTFNATYELCSERSTKLAAKRVGGLGAANTFPGIFNHTVAGRIEFLLQSCVADRIRGIETLTTHRASALPASAVTMLEHYTSWSDFDIFHFQLVVDYPLAMLCYHALNQRGLVATLRLDAYKLAALLVQCELSYIVLPYHHSGHAADVMQAAVALLSFYESADHAFTQALTPLEELSLLLAAAFHDVGHSGSANSFLTRMGSALSHIYTDESILENMHSGIFFSLIAQPELNAFANSTVSPSEVFALRSNVRELILATDLARHATVLKSFVEHKRGVCWTQTSNRMRMCKIILKAADVSHACRRLDVHLAWSEAITQEFHMQGDTELRLGLTLSSPQFDRAQSARDLAASNVGFIKFIVRPLFAEVQLQVQPPSDNRAASRSNNRDSLPSVSLRLLDARFEPTESLRSNMLHWQRLQALPTSVEKPESSLPYLAIVVEDGHDGSSRSSRDSSKMRASSTDSMNSPRVKSRANSMGVDPSQHAPGSLAQHLSTSIQHRHSASHPRAPPLVRRASSQAPH
jgi:hypothetical protein